MFVGERMSHPVITVNPDMPIIDALDLLKREHIRRTPVVKDGKMVGIITNEDLLNASPSPVTMITTKVTGIPQEKMQEIISPLVVKLSDIRTC